MFFWPESSMATSVPGAGMESGGAKTTISLHCLNPRTKKVIMFLHPPDAWKYLRRGNIPLSLYSEFNSRLPIRGQTHGWHTILAPAHSHTTRVLSHLALNCGLILGLLIPFPPSKRKERDPSIHPSLVHTSRPRRHCIGKLISMQTPSFKCGCARW